MSLTELAGTGRNDLFQETLSALVERAVVSLMPSETSVAVAVPIVVTPAVLPCLTTAQGRALAAFAGSAPAASVVATVIATATEISRRAEERVSLFVWRMSPLYRYVPFARPAAVPLRP